KQKTLDEIIANDVFGLLDSTYGDNASREIMFGQGKTVKLFGGFSEDVIYQEFLPGFENPLGLIVFSISRYHSNQFALSRILMNHFLEGLKQKKHDLQIFAMNRTYPGMPPFPEYGEKFPFLREAVMQTSISGPVEKTFHFNGEDYLVITRISKLYPQFVFAGVGRQQNFQAEVRKRVGGILSLLAFAFSLILLLSFQTAKDILNPLNQLLAGIDRVKNGDFNFSLSFSREDELGKIAHAFTGMLEKLSEKQLLANMVSTTAAEMVSSDELEAQARKGRKRKATVLYLGINEFEQLIAKADSASMSSAINRWFTAIFKAITSRNGEIDKVLEGKILAVFFVDEDSEEQVARSIRNAFSASIEAVRAASQGGIVCSCGIHYGEVISGLMGNSSRRDFTIIGDTVNMAARCFSMSENLQGKTGVFATEIVARHVDCDFSKEDLGLLSIKGKADAQRLIRFS
ncbi:MAG: adenylate/guanylate cyclase domain-containing protein, partial [Candidatus Riflebacteria bacterium]